MALDVLSTALALLQPDARDDRRPRARGDPAPGHRPLDHAVRDPGTAAVVARLLQGRRTRPLLRVPPHRPEGAPVAAGWRALGAQVPPAPRAVRPAGVHLPRCHLRRDPPGPVTGDHLHGHHGGLHLPDVGRAHRSDGHRQLLVGTGRGPVPGLRGASPRPAGRTGRWTSGSTTSWRTTWPPSSGSTTWPGNRSPTSLRTAMEAFRAAHPRGRNGTVVYQPDVLGIDPARTPRGLVLLPDALRGRGRGPVR